MSKRRRIGYVHCRLPSEIVAKIQTYLDAPTLLVTRLVSRRWNETAAEVARRSTRQQLVHLNIKLSFARTLSVLPSSCEILQETEKLSADMLRSVSKRLKRAEVLKAIRAFRAYVRRRSAAGEISPAHKYKLLNGLASLIVDTSDRTHKVATWLYDSGDKYEAERNTPPGLVGVTVLTHRNADVPFSRWEGVPLRSSSHLQYLVAFADESLFV